MEDERIVELFLQRSNDAVAELDGKYGASMLKVAKNILKNDEDAKECLNDAYLGIWNAVPPAKPSPLSAFAFKVIRNIAIKRYRRNTAQMRDERSGVSLEEIGDVLPDETDIIEQIEGSELTSILNRYLKTLDRTNLYIFMRKYWYFDQVPEISSRLGITDAAVYQRLARMKNSLHKYLIKQGVIK